MVVATAAAARMLIPARAAGARRWRPRRRRRRYRVLAPRGRRAACAWLLVVVAEAEMPGAFDAALGTVSAGLAPAAWAAMATFSLPGAAAQALGVRRWSPAQMAPEPR